MTARPRAAERVYRGILRLYPAEFRRRFGEDMVQLFHDRLRDARSGRAPAGAALAWIALLVDAIVMASLEHVRRYRTVAHSLSSAPSIASRVLGVAGIVAGLAILVAYVIDLPSGLFRDRLIVFSIGVIAIAIGVHRRQASRAPWASLVVSVILGAVVVFFLVTVLVLGVPAVTVFWSGVALWLGSAAFGAVTALIGVVSRIGGWAVAIGSLVALTGIDRLGLVSEASPTIFNTLSQVGIVTMAIGWILLGLDLAMRRVTAPQAGGS
ncbi:MAG: hypothetical protein ABI534_06600 [Chloroflexota bacterium]